MHNKNFIVQECEIHNENTFLLCMLFNGNAIPSRVFSEIKNNKTNLGLEKQKTRWELHTDKCRFHW